MNEKRTLISRPIDRRRVLKGAAAVGIGAAASSTFSVPMVVGQEKGTVTFWTTHTDVGLQALQQITEDFNAQSETTVAEVVQRPPADVTDSSSLITAVRGGEGPDVYLLDRFIVAERAAQGLLQDLTQLMEDAGDNPDLTEKFVPFSAAEATYNGTPFALPFDTDVRMLFYNTKMLGDAGVDLAAWDPANGPLTVDAVKEAFMTLNVDDGEKFTQVGFIPYFGEGWHYTWGFDFGGEFFDYENCQVTPDNEKVLEGAQWVYDYAQELNADKLYAFIQAAMRPGTPPTDNPFIQGRLGGFISGNWMFQQFRTYMANEGADVGYTYIPVPTEGMDSTTWAGGWSGVIPQGAQNIEGGYEYLRYLCGPEGSRAYVQLNSNLPVLKELLEEADLFDENLTWVKDNLFPTTRNRPPIPVGAKYWDELTSAWESIYLNQATPEEALGQARENTQAELETGGFCPIEPPSGT